MARKNDKKKRLTKNQEFEIMKLVLDKFLWLGFGIMAYGVWIYISSGMEDVTNALTAFIVGVVVLILFMVLIVREYEIIK